MSGLNKALLIGHIGRDPDVRKTANGEPVVSFSLATTESWRDKATGERRDRTEWHQIVIFNEPLCKIAEQYCKKGSKVWVEGQIKSRTYTDKSGDEKRAYEIVLPKFGGTITLLDTQRRDAPDPDSYGTTTTHSEKSLGDSRRAAPSGSPEPAFDDDIPF